MNGVRYMFALLLGTTAFGQVGDQTVTLPDLIQNAQQWAQDNLGTNVLNALPKVDDPATQQFLRDIQKRFQGDYVIDLASLRQTAQTVLPLLESQEKPSPTPRGLRRRWIILMLQMKSASRFRRQKLKPTGR